jgi:acyl-CoA synthetase (NDP forming)
MPETNILAELDRIFHPRSVALIGASNKQGKIGRVLMERFLETGFRELYPVNPGESEILGVRAYRTVAEIPGPVDLAIVVTPTDSALAAVKDCAAKRVRAIVITTSGFGETGEKGKELEQEMVRIARGSGARIIGPNCVGIYCPSSKLPFPLRAGEESGSVGVVSQSGFFADFLTLTATGNGITFSKAVSCGNESDLKATDFLEYLGEDPQTETIVAYIEGMKDGRRFYHLSKEISKKKPIILWKGGITEAGARAVVSHTGALAGSRRVWEGALRQAGIISVKSFEEALDCLYAFHLQPLPRGNRVAIISGPGGTAVGTTDRCLELGLEVPQFSNHTIERLHKALPPVGGSVKNPIDLSLASLVAPNVYKDAIRIAAEDEGIDMLLVIAVVGGEVLRDIILEATRGIRVRKPLVVTVMAGSMQAVARDFPLFLTSGISVYPDAARAAKALARLLEHARFRTRGSTVQEAGVDRGRDVATSGRRIDVIETALKEGRTVLSEHESKETS